MNRPAPRQGYNAQARRSTAGSRKKRKHSRQAALGDSESDPNASIVLPKTDVQKDAERRERLRQELLAQSESGANGKKKKRLEKYIEKKLKQEERIALFEKLSESQAQVSTALNLYSSATLGTGRTITHQERLEKVEHRNVQRLMDGRSRETGRKRKRSPKSSFADVDDGGEDDSFSHSDDGPIIEMDVPATGTSKDDPVVLVDSGFSTVVTAHVEPVVTAVGGALRRNTDGSVVMPRAGKKNTKIKTVFSSWKEATMRQVAPDESDSSFDSSDSAYDSSEEDDSASAAGDNQEEYGEAGKSDEGGEVAAEEEPLPVKRKKLGFKDWALGQLSSAKGYVATPQAEPSPDASELPLASRPPPKKHTQGGEMRGPLGKDFVLPATALAKHLQESVHGSSTLGRKFVSVTRLPEVEETRLQLPIIAEEQSIMEAILLNPVVIICGETGSGKTTQVPQFLYEAGFGSPDGDNPGMIGVTQPRRVAAMSMASRVAHELSLTSSKVSYQIRYDATVSPDTSIKFMTDGVLLRELATDFLLTKYSVIIIDEAHERSMNTDILIGVLSRVIKLREDMWPENKDGIKPLRLIIMSATLRVSDFADNTTLFASPPPIINVPARQYPVTIHFSRRTSPDYVNEAIRKASKIHARLPPGGILIFLTGQNEIVGACRRLEGRYSAKALRERRQRRSNVSSKELPVDGLPDEQASAKVVPATADVEAEDMDFGAEQADLADDIDDGMDNAAIDEEALESDDELNTELGLDTEETDIPMHVVPLYALLPSEKQMQVFKPPPEGSRLVVVSTNVAETSLTIPGIRYVVDCGRAKERHYNIANGIQNFQVSWIAKASAAQRAGRAGRTGPGHCYRLYSSALYENYFNQFSQPEILRMPIDGVVLQMKSMHIDAVVNFPFPTPPDRQNLRVAETVLSRLGALANSAPEKTGQITDIGRAMSLFPLSPRFSRMLVSGRQHGCLPYIITVVSMLSVGDPFIREEALENDSEDEHDEEISHLKSEALRAKELRRKRRKAFFESQEIHSSLGNRTSDIFRMLSVVGAYEYAGGGHDFCAQHFIRPKAMEEIHKLRAQISGIVKTNFPDADIGFVANLAPPSPLQTKVLRQLVTAGFIDQIAVRKDKVITDSTAGQQHTTSRGIAYRAIGIDEDVFIHPSSVLASSSPPDFVSYLEVVRTTKIWLKGVTVVHANWLSTLGKTMCTFSKPIKRQDGTSVVVPHFGPLGWELPPTVL